MVRLADLDAAGRDNLLKKIPALPRFAASPRMSGPALSRRRVAIVTTAGLHGRGDRPFRSGAADYRVIPGDAPSSGLVMSHVSVNFDRSGYLQDWNVVFPLDRLRELAAQGRIGSVAAYHYSFMGAVSPVTQYEPRARELAGLLRDDKVDAVVLSPV